MLAEGAGCNHIRTVAIVEGIRMKEKMKKNET